MNINPEIRKVLIQYNIPPLEGILYLLSIYHNLTDVTLNTISESVRKQINLTKIVERDYGNKGLVWNVPLYADQALPDQWDWINDWRDLFGNLRADAIGVRKNCFTKIKKYFSEHPEVRKEDIMKATYMYLHAFKVGRQDIKYLQRADYFISKIVKAEGGTEYNSRLDMYLEILKKDQASATETNKQMSQIVK